MHVACMMDCKRNANAIPLLERDIEHNLTRKSICMRPVDNCGTEDEMKRETAENLVEALEIASVDCLVSTQRDRLRFCLGQVVIDMMADDGTEGA